MSKFSERLKLLRTTADISQAEFAKRIGVSKSSINMYERGEREPGIETLEAFADYFNVDMDYLLGKSECRSRADWQLSATENTRFPSPRITEDYTTFPVIGEIAAGYDHVAIEDWDGERVDIPNTFLNGRSASEYFVLLVKGESMYPTYQDGDRVLILRQTTLDYSGQVGAIMYDDEYATLKRVEYVHGEDWLRLVPINPTFPPIKIENEDLERCRVLGVPKLLIREIE